MKKELILVNVAHPEFLEWSEPRVLNVARQTQVKLFGKRIRDFPHGAVVIRNNHSGLILSDTLNWIMG